MPHNNNNNSSMPPPGSQPSSLSSGGSAASGREILVQRDNSWQGWEADQRMSKMQEDHLANLARMQSDRTRSEAAMTARISELETENKALKDSYSSQDLRIKHLLEEVAALKARQQGPVPA
jgi:hypothetical protein